MILYLVLKKKGIGCICKNSIKEVYYLSAEALKKKYDVSWPYGSVIIVIENKRKFLEIDKLNPYKPCKKKIEMMMICSPTKALLSRKDDQLAFVE